ncbi:MAG: choice-of-anchor L domain-containing protein, partial [Psychroflexus maritimus]
MWRSLLLFIFLISTYVGFSQDINWPQAVEDGDLNATDEIVSCEGSIIASNEGNFDLENESFQITICPDDEDSEDDLIVFLTEVSVQWPNGLGENPNFFFSVHDGDSTAAPVIASSSPDSPGIPAGIVADDNSETGCLTIVFETGSYIIPGFPSSLFEINFDFGCRLPCQEIVPQLISIEADEFCSDEDAETPTFAPDTDITFTADAFTSNESNFDDLTFEWNFNGNTLTGSEVTTSFTNPGLIVGTLTVIDEFLCESEPLSVNVIVGDEILNVSPQDEAYSLEELIADVMVGGGECANVNNIEDLRESPNGTSIGYFSRGCSDFPFNEGLVIGSAGVQEIVGEPAENGWGGTGGTEENLLAVVGGNPGNSVNDASVIEFEFSSFESTVSFDYIYASQEYTSSYPCSYADPFAFIISGPGIEDEYEYIPDGNPANQEFQDLGGFNVATITPSGLDAPMPTTATNIHPGAPFNCGAGSLGEFFYPEFFNTLNPPYHEVNGETNRLTADFEVVPCETYTLKLMVADWNDTILNSFVFI